MLGQLRFSRRRALAISALAIAAAVGSVVGPLLFGAITNVIVEGTTGTSGLDWSRLSQLLFIQAAIYVAVAGFTGLQGQLLTVGVQRSIAHLRERIEDVILNRRPDDGTERLIEIAGRFKGDGAKQEVADEAWRSLPLGARWSR